MLFLCKKYGAFGSAIGTAISLVLVQGLIINVYYHKKCNINIVEFWKNILEISIGLILPCAIGAVMKKFIVISSVWILIMCILCYTLVYCISMWAFGMKKEEKDLVKKLFGKLTEGNKKL